MILTGESPLMVIPNVGLLGNFRKMQLYGMDNSFSLEYTFIGPSKLKKSFESYLSNVGAIESKVMFSFSIS